MIEFDAAFRALTDHEPFPWQQELYRRFCAGDIPPACDVPTGLGKTSVIPIWLIALANHGSVVPRRLGYVVNRRTVVDQATDEADRLLRRLLEPEENAPRPEDVGPLRELAQALRGLTSLPDDDKYAPLGVSTLRGQRADNGEWYRDPARPAVVVGTVDMIGSRLLFRGYRAGFKTRPLFAGFLGQDALIVHDEAHLEPAFQEALVAIRKEQDRCGELRRLAVMELSATARGGSVFGLTDEDRSRAEVTRRLRATKTVRLHEEDEPKKLADRLAELALAHHDEPATVLVFAQSVEVVEKVADKLQKAKQDVERLTGTMRGKERDELTGTPVFRRFLPGAGPGERAAFLVCTSAGEVGVNISADHLICDLSTFESLAQRLGRVNRFGDRTDTRADVVHPTKFEEDDALDLARKKTLDLLVELRGNGSPDALGRLEPDARRAAFSPPPEIVEPTDILFDAWALTAVRDTLPGRPPVEPYLHGRSAFEVPETYVAWRQEVGIITGPLLEQHRPEELLEFYPLKPQELLRDRSSRVFDRLASLARSHPEAPVWLVDDEGQVDFTRTLGQVTAREMKDQINGRTVLLPEKYRIGNRWVNVGGLSGGLLTGNVADPASDVSDELSDGKGQRRVRRWSDEQKAPRIPGLRLILAIDTRSDPDAHEEAGDEAEAAHEAVPSGGTVARPDEAHREPAEPPDGRFWYWYERADAADDDGSRIATEPVAWDDHTADVERIMRTILDHLPLSEDLKECLCLAARFHDLGKKRLIWQRSIGNRNSSVWLAKSGGDMRPMELTDYRHEFGSLLDTNDKEEFRTLSADQRDLVLHLIAAHHGRGRPHFPADEAFDPERPIADAAGVAAEVPARFARLQRRYGRWGLAYLESLLRVADYAASARPSLTRRAEHE
jgi:CRISPR-associated endonuclease/helicase Cas3